MSAAEFVPAAPGRGGAGAFAAPRPGAAPAAPARRRSRARLRPVAVLRLAVFGMVLGNLGRAPVLVRGGPELPVLLNDVLVVAVLAASALACLQARRLRLDLLGGVALAFTAVGVGAGLWAAQKYGIGAGELLLSYGYLARWLAYFGLYVSVTNVAREADAAVLWRAVEHMVLVFAAFGIFQSLAFEHFAQTIYPAGPGYPIWDYQGHRLVSTLLDPNFAGMLIAFPLLVQAAQLSFGVPVRTWKPLLLLAALLMTVSRGAILATTVGMLVVVSVRGVRPRLARVAGVAGLAALPFLPVFVNFALYFNKFTIDDSAMARVQSWGRALTVIADNPLFGIGFNTYKYVQRAYGFLDQVGTATGLDGGLLFITVLTGAVGLVLYLVLLGALVKRCRRLWADPGAPREARAFALGTGAATIALVLHSLTVSSLTLPFLMEPHWLMAGVVALHARARRAARAGAPA